MKALRVASVVMVILLVIFHGCNKISTLENNPPEKPGSPNGPIMGTVGIEYAFSVSTNDPDGDKVAYRFDWGDGDTSNWSEYVASGEAVTMSHRWTSDGTYYVKAQAKDINGEESAWGESLAVHIVIVDPPSNLSVSADNSGSQVFLIWDASPTMDIDGYIIYFKPLGGDFSPIDTVSPITTEYLHDPNGVTGEYKVTAFQGEIESAPTNSVSTIPVMTEDIIVYELNAGTSGYGWNRTNGEGGIYSMTQPENSNFVDFYITNFATGFSTPPYYIASPDLARASADSCFVPDAPWRINGILAVDSNTANSILPQSGNYLTCEELSGNSYYAVHTEDHYFGVIQIVGTPDYATGRVTVRSWIQLVRGLRIIKHE